MNTDIVLLNETYSPDEQFAVVQHSGNPDDLPECIQEVITQAEVNSLKQGDWVVLIDDEIVSTNEFHPSHIIGRA